MRNVGVTSDLYGALTHAAAREGITVNELAAEILYGEDFAWAHGCLADREDDALQDQPVAVGAARTGTPAQPLILLVADHFEVGPVDSACSLPDAKAGEDVSYPGGALRSLGRVA